MKSSDLVRVIGILTEINNGDFEINVGHNDSKGGMTFDIDVKKLSRFDIPELETYDVFIAGNRIWTEDF